MFKSTWGGQVIVTERQKVSEEGDSVCYKMQQLFHDWCVESCKVLTFLSLFWEN